MLINGVGISEMTPIKQRHFRNILAAHIKICKSIIKRNQSWIDPVYYYFDLNAGPGKIFNQAGSPVIFLELARLNPDLKFKAIFIEISKENYLKLNHQVAAKISSNIKVEIWNGDNKKVLPKYFLMDKKKKFGLVYSDTSGQIPDFDLLSSMMKYGCYSTLDVLINCAAATIKRVRRSSPTIENRSLVQFISSINKKNWILRDSYFKHQWTMLIGTNWNAFPVFKNFGFYGIYSSVGQKLLNKFNYTSKGL